MRHVVEMVSAPVFVVDATSRVRVVNRKMRDLAGDCGLALEGHAAGELFRAPGGGDVAGVLDGVRRGAIQVADLSMEANQCALDLNVSFTHVGASDLVLGEVRTFARRRPEVDVLVFNVGVRGDDRYRVRRGASSEDSAQRRPCYEVFHQRTGPCAACPLERGGAALFASGGSTSDEEGDYWWVTARPKSDGTSEVTEVRLGTEAFGLLAAARLERLAVRHSLTARERAVLELLAMGRALEYIGTVLGVSVNTVRFHKGNILKKLGADSRLDLMRLLL